MVQNDTSKKGGDAPRATDSKRKRGVEYVGILILRKPH